MYHKLEQYDLAVASIESDDIREKFFAMPANRDLSKCLQWPSLNKVKSTNIEPWYLIYQQYNYGLKDNLQNQSS